MSEIHRNDLVVRAVEGEVIILDRVLKNVHQLNPTATCIWSLCERPLSAADIAAHLEAQFDVPPGVALNDVVATLAEFRRLRLLVDERVAARSGWMGGTE